MLINSIRLIGTDSVQVLEDSYRLDHQDEDRILVPVLPENNLVFNTGTISDPP